jgi:NADPH:quinone reductase-like Zn-dependent oxidoreductase
LVFESGLVHEHGGPEVLRVEDAPDPEPIAGEALVRVRACALNHLDPLAGAAAAHQRMEESSQFGKIVLEV